MTTNTNQTESNDMIVSPSLTTSVDYFTDSKQSDIFAGKYSEIARYCHEDGCWFVWDKTHWTHDISNNRYLLAEKSIREQMQRCIDISNHDEMKKFTACLSAGRLRSIVDLASAKMTIKKSEFNPDPWLFNCKNGIVDLRTGELIEHAPEYFQCYVANVDFAPDATCPQFEAFIDQIMLGDREMVDYLQRAMGYTLTGLTSEHCFFILMGGGRNGKTTLLRVMSYIWSKYSQTVAAKTLMVQKYEQTPSDIAQLEGKRFAQCSETDGVQKLNEARLKSLTGGDEVQARRRYADEHYFTPQFKLWVATNTMPKISGTDEGIWRRIHKIPFNLSLKPEEVDRELETKLTKEASGILNWLLEGCLQWQQMGVLNPPEVVRQATQEYRAQMDSVREFIDDCLHKREGEQISNGDMYKAFSSWCYDNIRDQSVISQKELTQRLNQAGFEQKRSNKGRYWSGVTLLANETSAHLEDDISDEEMVRILDDTPRNILGGIDLDDLPF